MSQHNVAVVSVVARRLTLWMCQGPLHQVIIAVKARGLGLILEDE